MRQQAGVYLSQHKKALVEQRLQKRLLARGLTTYEAYLRLLGEPGEDSERALAIDLLTTHETFFFREPRHFEWLRQWVSRQSRSVRIWSAACSTGEEVWSLAMLLADAAPAGWHILGSDISTRVLALAQRAHYPMNRIEGIPEGLLHRFCLKGVGPQAGTLLVDPVLGKQVSFRQINLAENLPEIGLFDVIFLRNVLIYFDFSGKSQVLARVVAQLVPGGILVVSHSESLHGLAEGLQALQPGVYRRWEG
ncbi:CheR family methyltransferase [Chitinibacteraceae bacterium HSL-7]